MGRLHRRLGCLPCRRPGRVNYPLCPPGIDRDLDARYGALAVVFAEPGADMDCAGSFAGIDEFGRDDVESIWIVRRNKETAACSVCPTSSLPNAPVPFAFASLCWYLSTVARR